MKFFIISLLIVVHIYADKVNKKTIGCPTIEQVQKISLIDVDDALALDMYVIANSCVLISKGENVEALGYDPRNSKELFQKVLYKKTNDILFLLRSSLTIEQGGKKSTYRF